jgi:predicted nucleic acid-binding protein
MGIDRRVSTVDIDDVSVSAITIAELLYGAYNSVNVEKNISKVKEFEDAMNVIDLDRESLEYYARIKANLRAEGKMLDDFDILIAATAIVNSCVLVTNNTKHFERIDGLTIENWISQ